MRFSDRYGANTAELNRGTISISLKVRLWNVFYEGKDQITREKLSEIVKEVKRNAEDVYFQGPPAMVRVVLELPEDIDTISTSQTELVFYFETNGRTEDVYSFIDFPMRVGNASGELNVTHNKGLNIWYIRAVYNETGDTVVELIREENE